MKIIIMRHGQPQLDLDLIRNKKLSPNRLGEIVNEYEHVGLKDHVSPPECSQSIANKCEVVFSSNLKRAIQSVHLLGVEQKSNIDPCFQESSLPYLNWDKPQISFFSWCIIFRIAWLFGFSKNGEPFKIAKQRAILCAALLQRTAQSKKTVLLLGHGIMNRLITKELKSNGWKKIEATGESYWAYSVYEHPFS